MKAKRLIIGLAAMGIMIQQLGYIGYENPFNSPIMADTQGVPFGLSTVTIDQDIYIKIDVDPSKVQRVEVNGDSVKPIQLYGTDYYYRVTKSDEYRVVITGLDGYQTWQFITVNLDEQPPKLKLTRKYYDDKWYIEIEASDDYRLKQVKLDDEGLDFSAEGGKRSYKVDQTKTYQVTAEDDMGHKTVREIYVDITRKDDKPRLKLSKEFKDDAWYLIIDASDDYGIKEVKVNGEQITFESKEGRREYKISRTDAYRVDVTNEDEKTTSDSLYIDIREAVSIPPEVTLQQVEQEDGSYIQINVKDNKELTSIEVEGQPVDYNKQTMAAMFKLNKTGIYTVSVKDDENNEVKETIVIKSLKQVQKKQVIKYKANSKAWTKNNVSQTELEVAPAMMNGSFYLPLRAVADALGIKTNQIAWDAVGKTVTITDEKTKLEIPLSKAEMKVNGQTVTMKAPAESVSGRILLPISSITSVFASKQVGLDWNNALKELTIIYEN